MGSLAMKCIKYLLFLFNLIFALTGIVVITIGLTMYHQYEHYNNFIDDKLLTVQGIFILVGVFIFIVAFFGCCGAINESNYMLITFTVLLCLIFVLEIAAGVVCLVMKDSLLEIAEAKMNSTLSSYNTSDFVTKMWNTVQGDNKCCGLRGPQDWAPIFQSDMLPEYCCNNITKDDNCVISNAYTDGCLTKFKRSFERNSSLLANCGIAVAILQCIGVIFACHLSRSIHRNETV